MTRPGRRASKKYSTRGVGDSAQGAGGEALFEHESDYDRESPVETGFSLLQVEVEVKVLVTYTLTSFPVLTAAAAVQQHLPRCRTLSPLSCLHLT